MKEKIKEVQQYFKDKIFAQEFEIIDITRYQVTIKVDEFTFNIWIGNFYSQVSCKHYDGSYNFMDLNISDSEAEIIHNILKAPVDNYIKDILIQEKEKELEDLKNSLQNETN